MNKLLMNVALCTISLTSVSYGSDDALRTPEKGSATSMQGGVQRFEITDSTPREDLVAELRRKESEVNIIRNNVKVYLKDLARILTTDETHPVKQSSETIKLTATEFVSSIQSYKDANTKLEAEKKALEAEKKALEAGKKVLEKRLRQWKYGVIVVSSVVIALIYQNVLDYGYALLSLFMNSLNSFKAE